MICRNKISFDRWAKAHPTAWLTCGLSARSPNRRSCFKQFSQNIDRLLCIEGLAFRSVLRCALSAAGFAVGVDGLLGLRLVFGIRGTSRGGGLSGVGDDGAFDGVGPVGAETDLADAEGQDGD